MQAAFFLKDFYEMWLYLSLVNNAGLEVDGNFRVLYSFTNKNLSSWAY